MYRYSIPIDNEHFKRSGRERVVKAIREAGIDRVFLAIGAMTTDQAARCRMLDTLADNLAFLKNEGFETGVWLWAFMCRGGDFTRIAGVTGGQSAEERCPADPEFREFAAGYIEDIARLSPDIILLDDDLRFGHHECGLGCLCEHHLSDINNRLGTSLSRGELSTKIFSGGESRYRDAYMKSLGGSIREYSLALRAAVDRVNPSIRLGQCACITSWDQEGITAPEVSLLLAGNTRPFLRTIGAPYWAVNRNWGNRLGDVIDLNRREIRVAKALDDSIEVVGEGDVYPRPRYVIPASYLELLDLALIADGAADGLHKYMLDYFSAASDYEPGYLSRHNADKADREIIAAIFSGKTQVGVRVLSTERKFAGYELPENGTAFTQDMLFSRAYRFATGCSLPITFDGGCAGILFGEDAKYSDADTNLPLIIDLHAAKILGERGIDTGILDPGGIISPSEQYFPGADDYTAVNFHLTAHDVRLKDGAKPLAFYNGNIPSVWEYSVGRRRFLVLNFHADRDDERFWRNYHIQSLVTDFAAPPVSLTGEPDLYILAAESADRLAVLLLNLSADLIPSPEVTVPRGTPTRFVNCSGAMDGGKLRLSKLHAFDFAAFEIAF